MDGNVNRRGLDYNILRIILLLLQPPISGLNDKNIYPEHNIFHHQKSVDIAALNICFAYIE